MKSVILVILLATAALSGCQTTEQRSAADDATCRNYGARPGSDVYVQCRMMADQTRATSAIANAQARMAAQQASANTVANMQRAFNGGF